MIQPGEPQHPRGAHITVPADRVPLGIKFGYASGGMAYNLMINSVGNLAQFVLTLALGVNPAMVGLALSIPRLLDAFADPLIGGISDNFQSRYGRRKPFMVVGGIGAGLTFALLWMMPHGWSGNAYFWWFLIISIIFFLFASLFGIPWSALGFSLTPDYDERTRLMAFNSFWCSVVLLTIPWLYAATQMPVFADTLQGAKWVGIFMGICMVALAMVSALKCHERVVSKADREKPPTVMHQIGSTLKNRPFLILSIVVFLMCVGIFSITSLTPYIAIYHIYGGAEKPASILLGWGGTAWQAGSLVFVFIVGEAGVRLGKKPALVLFLACSVVGCLLKWVCYSPSHPYLFLIPPLFLALGFCALWTLTSSMMADVCDLLELETGMRNEATLGAIYAWIMKLGTTLAFTLSGFILNATGFDTALGGSQPERTIFLMRVLDLGLPTVTIAGAILLTFFYPITEARAHTIRKELEKRRGTLAEVN